MAAPTPTARIAPVGTKMDDGHGSFITFAADPNVSFWEKSITPPGVEGGDAIDTTTHWNEELRTMALRQLKTLTDGSGTVSYDPAVLPQIIALVNVPTTVTYTFPNGDTWCFFGGLRNFAPGELVEGTPPEASITVTPTNVDPTTGDEELPVYTAFVSPPP
jgi:hypothetical protein